MNAAEWNAKYKVGQHVLVDRDDKESLATTTRSEAWELANGVSVIKLTGIAGGYDLSRILAVIPVKKVKKK